MGKTIRKTWDETVNHKVSREVNARTQTIKDEDVDSSDIPQLPEKFWHNAVRNPLYKPVKKQVTLRVDADVLAWLKKKSEKGYQTKLNAVLRAAMLTDLEQEKKRA